MKTSSESSGYQMMIDAPYRDWEYLSKLEPDFSPLPPLDEGSPGIRMFVLVPFDDALPGVPGAGLKVIQKHYHSVVNWVAQVSDFRLLAYPKVVGVQWLYRRPQIEELNEVGLAYRAITFLRGFKQYKAHPDDVWLMCIWGNARAVPCAVSVEEENNFLPAKWGLVNDPVISAWLWEAGLGPRRYNPVLGYPAFDTPSYASAVLAHELLHALGAGHHPTGIMSVGELGEDWPNIPIDNFAKEGSTMEILAQHPLARPKE
jgi:hypothetical protein